MSRDLEPLLSEARLAFFGKITASLSHELNNVLSYINELSGLTGDLLAAGAQGRPVNTEKLQRLAERIGGQVHRGEVLIKRLNRFSHSADVPRKTFDLGKLLEDIMGLAQRPATMKGFELTASFPDESINIHSDPFGLQHLVFTCFEAIWESPAVRKTVSVSCRREEKGASVLVGAAEPLARNDGVISRLRFAARLAGDLGGRMTEPAEQSPDPITIWLPSSTEDGER
ncbi:MAG: hypothetical protein AB1714_14155 [Acidobacteriota bacterium]